MNLRGLAQAVTLAGGFAEGQRRIKDDDVKRQAWEEDRRIQKQKLDAELGELDAHKNLRISLADASRPVEVQPVEGSVLPPDQVGPSLAMYRVGGKTTADKAEADKMAADANSPDAVATRQADAYRKAGAPEKALTLENAALNQKRSKEQYTQEQQDRARKLQEEGVFNAVRAFRAGDASGLVKAFNAGGEYKLDGEPVITKEDRDILGIGKVPTYSAKLRIIGPDGQVHEKAYNSHDLSMSLMPYEKALELQRKGTDSDNKAAYQSAILETKVKQLELAGQVAEAKALKAAAGGGPIGREERLRYTSLFGDAGRRLAESQKALTSLQKDPLFMMNARKPGTPEAAQLSDLQESIKTYGEERSLYQGLLAGSQAPGKQPSLSDAKPPTGTAKPKAAPAGDFSHLWK